MRIGFGYDVHQLVEGRNLILGGEKILHDKGLLGHSDADVLVHALMDSLLGALALGDIGFHFPDTKKDFKDIDSMILLNKVMSLITSKGYKIGNIDITLVAQKPKVASYIPSMRENISKALDTKIENVSIKATTEEGLGFTGREEGISCYSVCLLVEA